MFLFLLEKKAINMVELKQYKKIYREKVRLLVSLGFWYLELPLPMATNGRGHSLHRIMDVTLQFLFSYSSLMNK